MSQAPTEPRAPIPATPQQHPQGPQLTPEQQQQLAEFDRNLGAAFAEAINRSQDPRRK